MRLVAGDFRRGGIWLFTTAMGRPRTLGFKKGLLSYDKVSVDEIRSFRVKNRDQKTSWTTKLGVGGALGFLLGPIGLVLGLLSSGNKDETLAEIIFEDGRRALVSGSSETMRRVYYEAFEHLEDDNVERPAGRASRPRYNAKSQQPADEYEDQEDDEEPEKPLVVPLLIMIPVAGVFFYVGWNFLQVLL